MSDNITYDAKRFKAAQLKFVDHPETLTDDDVALLTLVDPTLGDRAKAKRAGLVPKETAAEQKVLAQPLTKRELHDFYMDVIAPTLATYRYKLQQLEARPMQKWAGTFIAGQQYSEASLVTRSGSLWCARKTTTTVPGEPHSDWTLIVKKGDAR